jgi:hypothetical protein
MTIEIKTSKKLEKLLASSKRKGIIQDIRDEVEKQRTPTKFKREIIRDMNAGISPVQKAGKGKKYSPSYKKAIGTPSLQKKAVSTKSISPVNLRLSGALHKSLKVFTKGNALIVQFNHFLADIHNRLGASKKKVVRRLLPTKQGERFNRNLEGFLFSEIKKAADKVAKQFTGR